jgi:hypothetical protein
MVTAAVQARHFLRDQKDWTRGRVNSRGVAVRPSRANPEILIYCIRISLEVILLVPNSLGENYLILGVFQALLIQGEKVT